MYQQLLLEKKNLDKIDIYEKLLTLEPRIYNLLWLSHFLDQSYSKTMSTIEEIDMELRIIDPNMKSIISEDNKVIICDSFPPLEALTTYLVQQDIPYRFLIEIIEGQYEHLDEFSYKNYASPSTVRRKLAPLGKFLSRYRIRLKLSTMELIGDERVIRAILASLLWLSTRGEETPISHLESVEIDKVVNNSLIFRPKNDHIPPAPLFRKIDADIAYHRVRNQHFVEDDPDYDLIITQRLLLEPTWWGKFIEAPEEHQYAETRYMAFRQFYGLVFFDENDPIFDIPREKLIAQAPILERFLLQFKKFVEEDIYNFEVLPSEFFDKINVLRGNMSLLFFTYYVFKTRVPFFFLLTESRNLARNKIFNSLHQKVEKILKDFAKDPELRWMNYCLDDMSKIFTAMILPEYELIAKDFHLKVSLVAEDQYIYNHKMEKFLVSTPYIDYQPFEMEKIEEYDVVIASSRLVKRGHDQVDLIVFPYTLDDRDFSDLSINLRDRFIEKNTL